MIGLPIISIAVFGVPGAGKTALIDAFLSGSSALSSSGAGLSQQRKLETDHGSYICHIIDSDIDNEAGTSPIRDAEAYLVLFDKSVSSSLKTACELVFKIADIYKAVPRPIILVGTNFSAPSTAQEPTPQNDVRLAQETTGPYFSYCELASITEENAPKPFEEAASLSMRRRRHLATRRA